MTDKNPNVFYEVGYAHALGKSVILLTEEAGDIPFDLKDFPHIVYEGSIAGLKDNLQQKIEWSIRNPNTAARDATADIEVYINGKMLLFDGKIIYLEPNENTLSLSIRNASNRTYSALQIQLALAGRADFFLGPRRRRSQ